MTASIVKIQVADKIKVNDLSPRYEYGQRWPKYRRWVRHAMCAETAYRLKLSYLIMILIR